jgi:hypothetical protein
MNLPGHLVRTGQARRGFMEYGLTKIRKGSSHQRSAKSFRKKISDFQGLVEKLIISG